MMPSCRVAVLLHQLANLALLLDVETRLEDLDVARLFFEQHGFLLFEIPSLLELPPAGGMGGAGVVAGIRSLVNKIVLVIQNCADRLEQEPDGRGGGGAEDTVSLFRPTHTHHHQEVIQPRRELPHLYSSFS